MPAAAWVTVIIAALIVATAALALTRVIVHLFVVRRTLAAVIGGVQVIAQRTSTVPASVDYVNAELKPVRDFCETI